MINNFPTKQKQFQQNNRSDVLGNIWSSYNLNFQENLGTLRISPRMLLNTSTADSADFGLPVAIESFDDAFFVVAGTKIYYNGGTPEANFVRDTTTGNPTTSATESDLLAYASNLWCTTTNDVLYKQSVAGSWTSGVMSLTTGSIHLMRYMKKFDRVYVTNGQNTIRSFRKNGGTITTATTGDYSITLSEGTAEYTITSMACTDTEVWIGIVDVPSKGRGRILQWDGISPQVTREFLLNASACVSLCVEDGIVYAIDSNGSFLQYDGTSFKEPDNNARLPVTNKLLIASSSSQPTRFMHPNGFIPTKNGTFYAWVNGTNGDNTFTQNENFPSGLWEFDREIGWTHRASPSYTPAGSSTITDFGQQKVSRVGALSYADVYSTSATRNGTILAGATYFTNATTTTNGIFLDDSNDTVQKKGYFVTGIIEADEIEEKFNRLWVKYKRFLNANDKIVFKYRNFEEEPVVATITWTSTTTFTTTTDITAYGVISDTGVGYEVEILQGTGAGSTAHITSITGSGTYTVTIDEVITGVTNGTAIARFQKWIKVGEIPYSVGSVKQWSQLPINNSNDTQIQIKGCFVFTGQGQFDELITKSEPNQKITN